jgi:hypothetical protein
MESYKGGWNMIFNTYETLAARNSSEGFQVIFLYVNDVTGGLFVNLLLFCLFCIVLLGSYFAQKRQTGTGDFPASFATAGFFIAGLSFLMLLIPNFINIFTAVISFAVAVIGAFWLYQSRTGD